MENNRIDVDNLFPEGEEIDVDNLFPDTKPLPKAGVMSGRVIDNARKGYNTLDFLKEDVESVGRGAVSGLVGVGGELENVGRWLTGNEGDTFLWDAADARERTDPIIDDIIGKETYNTRTPEQREDMRLVGEIVAPVGMVGKGALKAFNAIVDMTSKVSKTKMNLLDPVKKYDSLLAGKTVNQAGEVVDDLGAQNLLNLNVDPQLVSYLSKGSNSTRESFSKIFDSMQLGSTNNIIKMQEGATKVVGDSIVKRLKVLKNKRTSLGTKLEDIVNKELKDIDIPLSIPKETLLDNVYKMFGVDVVYKLPKNTSGVTNIVPKAVPNLAQLPEATRANILKLNTLLKNQGSNGVINGKQAHYLKRMLNELVDSVQVTEGGMTGNMQQIVVDITKSLTENLNKIDSYRNTNSKLSTIIEAEKPFKALQKGRNWDKANLDEVVGSVVKNIDNGSLGSTNYRQAIQNLDSTLGKFNFTFKDEPFVMLDFSKQTEKFFKKFDEDLIRKYGGDTAVKKLMDLVASGSVGNTYGAVHDIKGLTGIGLSNAQARKVIKERETALKAIRASLSLEN